LLHVPPGNEGINLALILAIQPIGLAAVLGGALVMFLPGVARAAMLASAVGWLTLVAVTGGGISLPVGALMVLAAAGGLACFLPGVRQPLFRLVPTGRGLREEPAVPWDATDEPAVVSDRDRQAPHAAPSIALDFDHKRVTTRSRSHGAAPFWRSLDERASYHFGYGPERRRAPRRRGGRRSWQRTAPAIALFAVLALGVPVALVLYAQPQGTEGVPRVAEAARPTPAPPARALTEPSDRVKLPAVEAPTVPRATSPNASTPDVAAPGNAVSSMSPLLVRYASPFDYCEAVGESDQPDTATVAVGLPDQLLSGVRQVTSLPDGEVLWRCMKNEVWICVQPQRGSACGKVPTDEERLQYCAAHPGAPSVISAGGPWRCQGPNPVLSTSQRNIADARGFDRTAWLGISKTPPSPASSG
jgi:hypothetical protein